MHNFARLSRAGHLLEIIVLSDYHKNSEELNMVIALIPSLLLSLVLSIVLTIMLNLILNIGLMQAAVVGGLMFFVGFGLIRLLKPV